jgi:hypothetical protein
MGEPAAAEEEVDEARGQGYQDGSTLETMGEPAEEEEKDNECGQPHQCAST